jgi:serine/threonine protein kinase
VRNHGPWPAAPVLALAAGLAEGLSAIHAAGLIHRDLKPSNVLLAQDGPRVIDFGISRAAEATALTHADLVIGSPGFMSPEQAEGGETGPPSDVFSLGAVLAFATSGQGPFGTGSTAALVYRVVHGTPALDDVPAAIRPVIERCLAEDPGQRPATAELLAELDGADLEAGWLPAPIAAELSRRAPFPDPPGSGGWSPGGPGHAPAAAAGAPESGVPTLTASRPDPRRDAPSPAASAPPVPARRRPPRRALLLAGIVAVAAAGTAVGITLARGHPAAGARAAGPAASTTASQSRAPATAGSRRPSAGGTPPAPLPTSWPPR